MGAKSILGALPAAVAGGHGEPRGGGSPQIETWDMLLLTRAGVVAGDPEVLLRPDAGRH